MQSILDLLAGRPLYHFTDRRNLPSIRAHGLLSLRTCERRGLIIPIPGGDQTTQDSDRVFGRDRYVHLCIPRFHRREYKLTQEGNFRSCWVEVSPDVLWTSGVKFRSRTADRTDAVLIDAAAAASEIPWRLLLAFKKEQSSKETWLQFLAASMAEVLIPDAIDVSLLRGTA